MSDGSTHGIPDEVNPASQFSLAYSAICLLILGLATLWVLGVTPARGLELLAMLIAIDMVLALASFLLVLLTVGLAIGSGFQRRRWLVAGVAGLVVLTAFIARPVSQGLASQAAATGQSLITFLSWNAQGVDPGDIAGRVLPVLLARDIDVLVLPETGGAVADTVSEALSLGNWRHSMFEREATSVFMVAELAEAEGYELHDGNPPWAGLLVSPRSPSLTAPVIVAVHVQQPSFGNLEVRESHLEWIRGVCDSQQYVVAVGDFNATPNHLPEGLLGRCVDVALNNGGGAASTWPTWLPSWLGISLDRMMVGPPYAAADAGFEVLRGFDVSGRAGWGTGAGADHWPVVYELASPP